MTAVMLTYEFCHLIFARVFRMHNCYLCLTEEETETEMFGSETT